MQGYKQKILAQLTLAHIQFPHNKLQLHQLAPVETMTFLNCGFQFIDQTSFENVQDTVKILTFMNMALENINLEVSMLFPNLKEFIMRNTSVRFYDVDFLLRIRATLTYLEMHPLIDNTNLDIFQGANFKKLEHIKINSILTQFKVIEAANFSSISFLKTIDLSFCHIEFIAPETFDHLTLTYLSLEGNHLTTSQLSFLKNIMNRMLQNFGSINLNDNRFICDCELYLYRNISYWKMDKLNQSAFEPELQCEKNLNVSLKCNGVQEIRPTQICASRVKFELYTFPKFDIKINEHDQSYVIKQSQNRNYRIWFQNVINFSEFNSKWGYEESKCPRKGYLITDTQCIQLQNKTEVIAINDHIPHSKFKILCINIVNGGPKKIWPLHCVTHRNFVYENHTNTVLNMTVYVFSVTIGIILAPLIIFIGRKYALHWIFIGKPSHPIGRYVN